MAFTPFPFGKYGAQSRQQIPAIIIFKDAKSHLGKKQVDGVAGVDIFPGSPTCLVHAD